MGVRETRLLAGRGRFADVAHFPVDGRGILSIRKQTWLPVVLNFQGRPRSVPENPRRRADATFDQHDRGYP
jgi:hypothetical protein